MQEIKFIENGKSCLNFYVKEGCSEILPRACLDVVEAAEKITGVKAQVFTVKDFSNVENGIIVALFDDESFKVDYKKEYEYTLGTDGFAVMKKDSNIIVLGQDKFGASYGVRDLIEKNADIIWARGAIESMVECLPSDKISITVYDYCEKSPFKVRVWNTCGSGTDNVDHGDRGTAINLARNKIIGVYHHVDADWYEYGVTGQSLASAEYRSIEEYIDTNPEYFMTYEDGRARRIENPEVAEHLESYVNYYHPEVPKIIARKIYEYIKANCRENDVIGYNMPDNPYFFMMHNGVKLHEQPFTTDCGVTVYPDQKNYKSTVYFNFMNRMIKELNRLRPNTILHTQSYMYSEKAPAIRVDDRIIIKVAPLSGNMQVSCVDPDRSDNYYIRDNLYEWVKVSNSVCMNAYWNSFRGDMYSRPIWKAAKMDLQFWRSIGIVGFTPEGKVDCSKLESYAPKQLVARKFYDYNEMYTWGLCKLMWNPDLDLEWLKKKYCTIVYKEVADEMIEYYNLIEKGYEFPSYVWWMSGGDVYIYQFIIKTGIKDAVLATLEKALAKAKHETIKDRVQSIYETLSENIATYSKFEDEDGEMLWCDGVNPLDDEQLDFMNNPNSIWNKAKPSTVLKDYTNLNDFPKEDGFARYMLYDEKNVYFGFTVKNPDIANVQEIDGELFVSDKDGNPISFRIENYFGGNALNTHTYFGYTCGFNIKDMKDHYYINSGSPEAIPVPQGGGKVQKIFMSDDPSKRAFFLVQVVPIASLDVSIADFKPYGHFCAFTSRYKKRVITGWGWKGFGLWSKPTFTTYKLVGKK